MLVRIVCFLLLFLNSCLILSQTKTISEIKINGAKKLKTALILKIISAKVGDSLDTKDTRKFYINTFCQLIYLFK